MGFHPPIKQRAWLRPAPLTGRRVPCSAFLPLFRPTRAQSRRRLNSRGRSPHRRRHCCRDTWIHRIEVRQCDTREILR